MSPSAQLTLPRPFDVTALVCGSPISTSDRCQKLFDDLRAITAPDGFIAATIHAMKNIVASSAASAAGNDQARSGGQSGFAGPLGRGGEPPRYPGTTDHAIATATQGPFAVESMTMDELVREHTDAVYRVALSVTRDPVLAEDVSQDALIKAWQALPSFRGDAPLRNWILRITHNTAISTLRRRRDELRDPDQLPERTVRGSVESRVANRMAVERFEEALNDLDNVSRSIVVLREVEGLSYTELCDVLDLPMPTIKTRLLRARRQLAVALEGWQP